MTVRRLSLRLRTTRLLVAVGLVGSLVAPASAHVSLTRTKITAEEATTLAFRAPVEREGTTNTKLESLAPSGFTITGCTALTGWTCDVEARSDGTVITWEAVTVGGPNDLRFEFDVVAPSQLGVQRFPTIQTYSDGHEAEWIADGEPNPAPSIEVVRPGEAVEPTEAPTVDHTEGAGTSPSPTDVPAASEPPAGQPSDGGVEPSEAEATAEPSAAESSPPASASDVDATTTPVAPGAGAGTVDDEAAVSLEDVATQGSGSGTGIVVVVVLVVAGAGAFLAYRRRA